MQLNQSDIDFLFAQLTLPGNDPRNAPLGTALDPTGIRDVSGVGNNIANPTWGSVDQPFEQLTGNVVLPTPGPSGGPQTGTGPNTSAPNGTIPSQTSAPTFDPVALKPPGAYAGPVPTGLTPFFPGGALPVDYATRNGTVIDPSAREISNLVADQSAGALAAVGYVRPGQQALAVLDDPSTTPAGGRVNPFTGTVNPLPYSTFTTMFGQFFDHGLDLVHKGADGTVVVPLLPSDPLYVEGSRTNFMMASRTNTIQVGIGAVSTDTLVTALGLPNQLTDSRTPGSLTGGNVVTNSGAAGTLMLNGVAIDIAANSSLSQVITLINAKTDLTNLTASAGTGADAGKLVLTAPVNQSINVTSPFIDLSQSYGSVASHTVFLREYDANGKITGALVSGVDGGMATWADIKLNAAKIGITLNDVDVLDIPEVRMLAGSSTAAGAAYLDANGDAWLVARHVVTGAVYYVQNSIIANNSVVLNANGTAATVNPALLDSLRLQTTGHAFLDDIAHSAGLVNSQTGQLMAADDDNVINGDLNGNGVIDGAEVAAVRGRFDNELLDAHFVAGDGRTNENIGLTAIHDVFHAEHKQVLDQIKSFLTERSTASIVIGNSGNNLVADLGITEQQTFTSNHLGNVVVGATVRAGTLVINGTNIVITAGSTLDQVVAAINAATGTVVGTGTGIAAVNNGGRLELLNQFHQDIHGNAWTGEMLFQSAKLVTEMEYQHLVFGEFVRKLSPNITPFGVYDVTLDPAITAEFAHAVYRFGHSMLTDQVNLSGFDPVTGLATGQDNSMGLIAAFLNPLAYTSTTAGEFALGGSQTAGNGIDVWVTDALRNNLVGLPLDLATLNIVRGRDTGMLSLNGVRADLFAQTGNLSLKPYDNWLDFKSKMVHEETLVNFVMAYSRDSVLELFGQTPPSIWVAGVNDVYSIADWDALRTSADPADHVLYATGLRAAAERAIADGAFMQYDQGINAVDFWLGGLAEAKVPGGMLGSTFDFIFAMQMIELQNADRFYYLNRLGGTNMLAEIEAQLFSDIVMRNTGVENLYTDIFSVPDAVHEMSAPTTQIYQYQLDLANARVSDTDVHGTTQQLGVAGWVGSTATGWTFYGNQGNYLDSRGVLNANGIGNASEVIGGTSGNDRIHAWGGNDTVWGKSGNDTIEGGNGNDFLHGETGNDTITDQEGDDWIWGDAGDDSINAGVGVDNVFGGDGNDTIFGGTGGDIMEGGMGDDLMYGDNATPPTTIPNNVGGLNDNDIMGGGEGNDVLHGGQGDDLMDGGEGNDILYGGLGGDAMTGWTGNDRFVMDASDTGFGNTMDGGLGYDIVDYSASNPNLVLDALGVQQQVGIWANLSLAPATLIPSDVFIDVEEVIGTRYNDTLEGGALIVNVYLVDPDTGLPTNTLDLLASTGLSQGFVVTDVFGTPLVVTLANGAQSLVAIDMKLDGALGNDVVTGGDGNDLVIGGAGLDTLAGGAGDDVIRVDNEDDVVVEFAGGGTDTVETSLNTFNLNDVVQPLPPILDPLAPDPLLPPPPPIAGALGAVENVTYTGTGNFSSTGNALNNVLTGGIGNDTLNGGAGNDTLVGGAGNDSYGVDSATDVITELAAGGTDLVNASLSYTLGAELENLTLTGNAAINGTGNAGANVITGNGGANQLNGGAGNDTLLGGGGSDTLTGGAGTDRLEGGTGNDVYVMDDLLDSVVENANSGTDTIQTTLNDFTLNTANVENLTFTGTGNFTGNGDAGNNVITGGAGADTLVGNAGNDTLVGGAGNDSLTGGVGVDSLTGGAGNDRFIYTNINQSGAAAGTRDLITDFTRGQDLIDLSGISNTFSFIGTGAFTATNQVRYSTVGGQTVIEANTTGNTAADFSIALGTVTALSAADFIGVTTAPPAPTVAGLTINGDRGRNTLNGAAGNDVINGNVRDDVLNGVAGNDTLSGGAGSDVLNGGLGLDVLTGGAGNDFFVFNAALDAANVDRITDFTNADRNNDTIRLENAIFTGLGNATGTLNAAAFRAGTAAADATDRIIYNNATGELFYDADGQGGAAQVLFATLDAASRPVLTNADFVVI